MRSDNIDHLLEYWYTCAFFYAMFSTAYNYMFWLQVHAAFTDKNIQHENAATTKISLLEYIKIK